MRQFFKKIGYSFKWENEKYEFHFFKKKEVCISWYDKKHGKDENDTIDIETPYWEGGRG